ncbi:MAG: LamG domain-containing protein [Thiogranum sp.]|nr:LamG domain-containing protein [Thiogranum sp.]
MNSIIELLASGFCAKRAVNAFSTAMLMVALVSLAACGGGASTETNPATGSNTNVTSSSYSGPNAATADIRAFQVNVWERLKDSSRCGACHVEGSQSPMFVRQDDVNLAYSEANLLIDLDAPASSRLVTKVAGGHNCWLSSNAACATAITSYIEDWVAGTSGAGRQIQLVAPVVVNPGSTLTFPSAVPPEFSVDPGGVWPLLTDNCAGCHVDSSATPQTPFFASANVNDAYEAVKSKINLSDPASSRLVVRLRDEFHNCWTQCGADADEMEAAINLLAAAPTVTSDPVQAPTVFSKAMRLPDGIVASGGSRHEADVIALYEFKTGSGNIALDSSGVLPELNLTLSGDVNWVGGWGIEIVNGKAQGSTANSKKLHDLITATGEYSIEAWVAPGNVVQEGPARIVSYSAGTNARNFTLGQTQYNYDFLHRSSTTDANGEAALSTADADEDLQATLQHVVVTFDPVSGRRIYVNGVFTDDVDPVPTGNLNDWDDSFAFVLGNEVSGDRLWAGTIRMVAIHNRALTQEQITQNFEVGVGEKFFLLFGIGDIINLPQSYIMFEVAQYDSYSYLFNKPTFINLDPNTVPGNIPLRRMSIGINGHEVDVGQAYRTLDTAIDGSSYDPTTGQVLSDLGTIIPLENGPQLDEFYLTFERLGGSTNVVVEAWSTTPPPVPQPAQTSDIGLRTFDEVNASMAAITTVDPQLVKTEFDVIRQQLPAVETIEGFLSAHQMAIAQLGMAYCNQLVEDPAKRADFFDFADVASADAFFGSNAATAFGAGDTMAKNQIVNALFEKMSGLPGTGNPLATAPSLADIKDELIGPSVDYPDNLYDRLESNCALDPGCQANDVRTRSIVKAMCGSVLGSAAMLVQ